MQEADGLNILDVNIELLLVSHHGDYASTAAVSLLHFLEILYLIDMGSLARTTFRSLRLPPEIRLRVYRLLADSHDDLNELKLFALSHAKPVWREDDWNALEKSCPLINLRRVCRQMNVEAGNAVYEMLPLTVSFLRFHRFVPKKGVDTFQESLQETTKWRSIVLDINDLEDAQSFSATSTEACLQLLTRFFQWWITHGQNRNLTINMDSLHMRGTYSELRLPVHLALEGFMAALPLGMTGKIKFILDRLTLELPVTIQNNGWSGGSSYAGIAIRIRDWTLRYRHMVEARKQWLQWWENKNGKWSFLTYGEALNKETGKTVW